MPSLRPEQLVNALLESVAQSGNTGVLVSSPRVQPRQFEIMTPEGATRLWIYAWTLTPGGRPDLADEYRIQMTSVASPLAENPSGPTLLMGYEPGLGVFGGFDLRRHRIFTAGSPSVQIDITALRQALQDGLAFHPKQNGEITVAIRPDLLMAYAMNAQQLHMTRGNTPAFRMMVRASTREAIPDEELNTVSKERRIVIQTITRVARAANFSEQVLNAYGHRCAVTRHQLRLVDAAHIVPVATPGSTDHVTNGIALSPTYHRAFDQGLIYLDGQHVMRLNPAQVNRLNGLGLAAGLESLSLTLGRIHLPADRRQWPDVRLIRQANALRQVVA